MLGGLGVAERHCCVDLRGQALWLRAFDSKARMFLNGKPVPAGPSSTAEGDAAAVDPGPPDWVQLEAGDRLVLGAGCVLVVHLPVAPAESSGLGDDAGESPSQRRAAAARPMDWQAAMAVVHGDLIAHEQREREIQFDAERELMSLRVKELETLLAEEQARQQVAGESPAVQGKSGPEGSKAGDLLALSSLEARLAQQVADTEALAKRHELELASRSVLDDQLLRLLPLVHEANAIATELGKGLRFAVKLVSRAEALGDATQQRGGSSKALQAACSGSPGVVVLVHHDLEPERDSRMWPAHKFEHRLHLMREMYQLFVECGRAVGHPDFQASVFAVPSGDPFFDPPEDTLVGVGRLQLEAVRYLLDSDEATPLMDYKGAKQGDLLVKVQTLFSEDLLLADEDEDFEDLAELPLGSQVDLHIDLVACRGLPRKLLVCGARSLYVAFRFPTALLAASGADPPAKRASELVRSPRVPLVAVGESSQVPIGARHVLPLSVSAALVEYTSSAALGFEVWVSMDPPGEFEACLELEEGLDEAAGASYDSEDDDDSDDEGIAPHGIAMVKPPRGQHAAARERQWQRDRQEGAAAAELLEGSASHDVDSGQETERVALADYHVLEAEVERLREENRFLRSEKEAKPPASELEGLRDQNASLRKQLEQAMLFIASSASGPSPTPPPPVFGANFDSPAARGDRKKAAKQGAASAARRPAKRLGDAQVLDRDING